MVKVIVGSQNPVKVKAVKEIFELFFNNVRIISMKPKLSISEQPFSLIETLIGAIERAYLPLLEIDNADYGVGIEAGFIKIPGTITNYLKFEICCIADNEEGITIGFSSGFEFPPIVIHELLKGKVSEAEIVMERITGIEKIGEKMGAIGYLTKGFVKREDLSKQSVIMALIPRINKPLYGERLPKASETLKFLKELWYRIGRI